MQVGEHYITNSGIEIEIVKVTSAGVHYDVVKTHEGHIIPVERRQHSVLKTDTEIQVTRAEESSIIGKGGENMGETVKTAKAPKAPKEKKERKETKRSLIMSCLASGMTDNSAILEKVMKAFPNEVEKKMRMQIAVYKSSLKHKKA
jgi:hypothetical protein